MMVFLANFRLCEEIRVERTFEKIDSSMEEAENNLILNQMPMEFPFLRGAGVHLLN